MYVSIDISTGCRINSKMDQIVVSSAGMCAELRFAWQLVSFVGLFACTYVSFHSNLSCVQSCGMMGSQYVSFVGHFWYIYVSFDFFVKCRIQCSMNNISVSSASMCAELHYTRQSARDLLQPCTQHSAMQEAKNAVLYPENSWVLAKSRLDAPGHLVYY